MKKKEREVISEKLYQRLKTDIIKELNFKLLGVNEERPLMNDAINHFTTVNRTFINEVANSISAEIIKTIDLKNLYSLTFEETVLNLKSEIERAIVEKLSDDLSENPIIMKIVIDSFEENMKDSNGEIRKRIYSILNQRTKHYLDTVADRIINHHVSTLNIDGVFDKYTEKVERLIVMVEERMKPEYSEIMKRVLLELEDEENGVIKNGINQSKG